MGFVVAFLKQPGQAVAAQAWFLQGLDAIVEMLQSAWTASRDSQRSLRLQQQAQSEITQANHPISLECSENKGFAPPAVSEKSQVCVALLVLAPAKVKSNPSWLMCWVGVKHRDLGAEPPPAALWSMGGWTATHRGGNLAFLWRWREGAGLWVPQRCPHVLTPWQGAHGLADRRLPRTGCCVPRDVSPVASCDSWMCCCREALTHRLDRQ